MIDWEKIGWNQAAADAEYQSRRQADWQSFKDESHQIDLANSMIKHSLDYARKEVRLIEARLFELNKQPRLAAGVHWRAKKYLYLIYPADESGHRRRVYVGAKTSRTIPVLGAIARQLEYERLVLEQRRWLAHTALIMRELQRVDKLVERNDPVNKRRLK